MFLARVSPVDFRPAGFQSGHPDWQSGAALLRPTGFQLGCPGWQSGAQLRKHLCLGILPQEHLHSGEGLGALVLQALVFLTLQMVRRLQLAR